MIKEIAYILIPASLTISVAMAESLPSSPVLLTPDQMDSVNAGLGAIVNVVATGNSSFFAITHTNAIAFTAVNNTGNPALAGYVEVAGGGAVSIAAGQGAKSNTNVTAATSMQGSAGSLTFQSGGSYQGSLVNITSNVILTAGSLFTNPF